MITRREVVIVLLALGAGLVGGITSSLVLMNRPLGPRPPAKATPASADTGIIRAHLFRVLDYQGNVRADLGLGRMATASSLPDISKNGVYEKTTAMGWPSLTLFDAEGKGRMSLSDYPAFLMGNPGWVSVELTGAREDPAVSERHPDNRVPTSPPSAGTWPCRPSR